MSTFASPGGARTAGPDAADAATRAGRRVPLGSLVYLAPVAMFVVLAATTSGVLSRTGIMSLLILAAVLGLASVGQTWAVMIGGIDLSIPATIGMANVALTTLYADGWSFVSILGVVLLAAVTIGAANGLVSSLFGLHPLVVTLGMGSLVTGSVLVATNGNTGGRVPGFITDAVSPVGSTLGAPVPAALLLWVAVSAIVLLTERRTVLGRHLFAVGANETAARLALVRPLLVRVTVYGASAVFAALSGLLLAGFSGGASMDIGNPYLFSTITAVVVGGTSLLGGAGSYSRTVAGVLVTTMFTTLLVGLKVGANMQQVMLGVAILVLITVYGRDRHVAQRL
ncbi:ABC transporter permease [Dactylosporangium sp. CA-233914]|uniref:ABC transporter permease n=1 Tax=Dactylosporangium sp. CA-233914 TaxID=3239934 RepID=UPI003D8C914E